MDSATGGLQVKRFTQVFRRNLKSILYPTITAFIIYSELKRTERYKKAKLQKEEENTSVKTDTESRKHD